MSDLSPLTGLPPSAWRTESAAPNPAGLRKLSVLMPIYNERWTLEQIVGQVLSVRLPVEVELVAVDDRSRDGSWDLLLSLAQADSRIKPVRHEKNQGKGAAIRTAIAHMTGDVAVFQDADLEYSPTDYPKLLEPLLSGQADAVFGSRYAGSTRKVQSYWHTMVNRLLTLFSNMVNDLNLTDMETCYKMIRADVLKHLCLSSHSFTLEPEITCRLSQWGARIYEVPVGYTGRSFLEGKKIRPIDGVKALWAMINYRYFNNRFTADTRLQALKAQEQAPARRKWILQQIQPFVGARVAEVGAGLGTYSLGLLNRERLVLCEDQALPRQLLKQRFGERSQVEILPLDCARRNWTDALKQEKFDTVFSTGLLEREQHDEALLAGFQQILAPGGHCVLIVPAQRWLHSPIDDAWQRVRRYQPQDLRQKLAAAGFEIVHEQGFAKAGSLGSAIRGRLLRRTAPSGRWMRWSDRCLPLAKICDRVLPIPASWHLVVARKPEAQALSKAA